MILADTIAEKMRSLLAEMPSWKSLANSQYVRQLSVFLGWAVEDAALRIERARQEAFIDTALNRSSILAHGEGMEYMPRKPVPARGRVSILNQGEYPFTIPRERELMSDARTIFTLADTVVVPAGESVEATVEQRGRQRLELTVDERKPFYEILMGRDISPRIVSFKVFVSENGQAFTEWKYDRLLTNS